MADETKTQIPKPTRQRGPMGRMGGMGRGAGNCAMELLLGFLKNPKYDIKPVLRFLEKHIQKLKHDGVVEGGTGAKEQK